MYNKNWKNNIPRPIGSHGKKAIEVKECLNRECTFRSPQLVQISADIEPQDLFEYYIKGAPFRDKAVYFTYKCSGCGWFSTISTSYTEEGIEELNFNAFLMCVEGERDPDVIKRCETVKRPEIGEVDALHFGSPENFGNFVIYRNNSYWVNH